VKIYLASPYTNGDKEQNVNLQIDIANELMNRDYAPYTPLLSHYQHLQHPRKESDWYALDNEFLAVCDILIRIKPLKDGVEILSVGADKEEAYARILKIPIFAFNTIGEMCMYLDSHPLEKI
jgi:nucleoside 2-deoxyribosyltransferase